MEIKETNLPGVLLLEPKVYGDSRGFFAETFRDEQFKQAGIDVAFVQDNHSRSQKGVLRGLHYQLVQPQGKIVRVTRGEVFDVAVDVRKGSAHFGQWTGCLLDEQSCKALYIPPGFAHGFVVMSEVADIFYKCSDYYHPESEQGVLWNDPDIAIEWPTSDVQLSQRDSGFKRLSEHIADTLPK